LLSVVVRDIDSSRERNDREYCRKGRRDEKAVGKEERNVEEIKYK
jgi:hypothetical protein